MANIKDAKEKFESLSSSKALSAKEYFVVLKLAISRTEHFYKIFEKSSYEIMGYLDNGDHRKVYEQAVKIVKSM